MERINNTKDTKRPVQLESWELFLPVTEPTISHQKSIMFPCNLIRPEGGPKLSLELANYLLIAPSDFHLMNRVQMEENASHKETGARKPMSITPLDISHSSAIPAAAGAVSRCLGMRTGGCRRSLFPPNSAYKGLGGWVGGCVWN